MLQRASQNGRWIRMNQQGGREAQAAVGPRRWGLRAHMGLLALAPLFMVIPTQGKMLIVPIAPAEPGASLVWSSRAGALTMGPGALPGSVLVNATASQLWLPALRNGAVLMRSNATACGTPLER
jgi:hypothetical protein